jgi:hypothetical protein
VERDLTGWSVVVKQIVATVAVVVILLYFRRLILARRRTVFAKAPTIDWILSGFLAILGVWIILNIWGILPLLTSTAVIGVWLFFTLWFAKDFFIDDYLGGIKLLTFYKVSPGDRIRVLGEEWRVEKIRPRETLLRGAAGEMLIPNARLIQLGIIKSKKTKRAPKKSSKSS